MSGYLQRLVLGAANPGGSAHLRSIQPVLGSVFSTPRLSVFPEAVQKPEAFKPGDEDVVFRTRPENFAPELSPSVDSKPPLETPKSIPERASDNRYSMPLSQRRASFQPLVASVLPAAIEESDVASATAVESAEPLPATEGKGDLSYRPLVAQHSQRAASEVSFSKPSDTLISGNKRQNKQDLSSRSELPAREPDEVQIHIGRIEVMAVPQPQAARPAARSVRKSVNLDEYLKRGDRRSG
jgi:hypothetical protein